MILRMVQITAKVFTRNEFTKRLVNPVRSDWNITAIRATIRIFWSQKLWMVPLTPSVRRPRRSESIATFPKASPFVDPDHWMVAVISAWRVEAIGPYCHETILRRTTEKKIPIMISEGEEGRQCLLWRRCRMLVDITDMLRRRFESIVMIFARIESLSRFR